MLVGGNVREFYTICLADNIKLNVEWCTGVHFLIFTQGVGQQPPKLKFFDQNLEGC